MVGMKNDKLGSNKKTIGTIRADNMHSELNITISTSSTNKDSKDCDCCQAFQSALQKTHLQGLPANISKYPSIYDEYAELSRIQGCIRKETESLAKVRKKLNDFHNILIDAASRTLDSVYGKPLDFDMDKN